MTKTSNVEASVRQKLFNLSKARNEDFQLVLIRYAIERILYRLSISSHRDRFVLKGATLFTIWAAAPHRATRDLDLLGIGENTPEQLTKVFRELCVVAVEDDGLKFHETDLSAAPIREDNLYGGIRIELLATLGKARIPLQVDVGFGDAVTPEPSESTLPVLLNFPAPTLRAYAKETVIAEKFHAMVTLGMTNSRMKDFFDVAWLADNFAFDETVLGNALLATFTRRGTAMPREMPLALTAEFYEDVVKQRQWLAFTQRINLRASLLRSVVEHIGIFLQPFVDAQSKRRRWSAGGPWR